MFVALNEERVASTLYKSALSKFLSVKRDVNFPTRKSVGRTSLTFGTSWKKKEIKLLS